MANDTPATPAAVPAALNAKEQAALALRLPNSGTPWLDMMIMQAWRRDMTMQLFQDYCMQKMTDTDVQIVKKAGLDAWLKINGADMSEALSLCEAMAKTTKVAKAVAREAVPIDPAKAGSNISLA